MRFQQIFVTINMLLDHTTSGHVIPQLGMSGSARPTESARPAASGPSGVVYPLTTQFFDQEMEYADQMKAQVEQKYGPLDVTIHNDRILQDEVHVDAPQSIEKKAYSVVPGSYPALVPTSVSNWTPGLIPESEVDPMITESPSQPFYSKRDKWIIGGSAAVLFGCAAAFAAALYHLRAQFKWGRHEPATDLESKI